VQKEKEGQEDEGWDEKLKSDPVVGPIVVRCPEAPPAYRPKSGREGPTKNKKCSRW